MLKILAGYPDLQFSLSNIPITNLTICALVSTCAALTLLDKIILFIKQIIYHAKLQPVRLASRR